MINISFIPKHILLKYFHTIRHLYCFQIIGRLYFIIKRRFGLIRPAYSPQSIAGEIIPSVPFLLYEPWNKSSDIENGRFCFLNKTIDMGTAIDWNIESGSLLWKYNLHYFQYLPIINRHIQVDICRQWIQNNKCYKGVGWNPYPLSLRIVNWIKSRVSDKDILKSLYEQSSYQYRSIEYFYSGNHLLENARALIFAGIYFDGIGESKKWKEKGLEIFRTELPDQILKDGGFYERSPMYHALMLEVLLDVLNILGREHPDRTLFTENAEKMSDFLLSMTHPSGKIALFNDTTEEIAPPVSTLLSYVKNLILYTPEKKTVFPDSGYYIVDKDPIYCIIDGGPPGPDHLLAHAHADIFSYELSVFGEKIIVDTGVYEYKAGKMRNYNRSTRAHNTVCIDMVNQIECWNSFRVARRYKPYNVFLTEIDNKLFEYQGEYDGYSKMIGDGIIHKRNMKFYIEQRKIEMLDTVDGKGIHYIENSIHLHPEVKITNDYNTLRISRNNIKISLHTNNSYMIEDSWYCPQFGLKLPNKAIRIGGEMKLPSEVLYTIYY